MKTLFGLPLHQAPLLAPVQRVLIIQLHYRIERRPYISITRAKLHKYMYTYKYNRNNPLMTKIAIPISTLYATLFKYIIPDVTIFSTKIYDYLLNHSQRNTYSCENIPTITIVHKLELVSISIRFRTQILFVNIPSNYVADWCAMQLFESPYF